MTVGRLKTPHVSGGASQLPGGFIHHKRWMLSGLTITITDSDWDAVSFTDFANILHWVSGFLRLLVMLIVFLPTEVGRETTFINPGPHKWGHPTCLAK